MNNTDAVSAATVATAKGINDNFFIRTKWHESLSFRVTAILLALLLLASAVVYYVIQSDGRQALIAESEKLTEQVGSNAVNKLLTDISKIEVLTKTQASAVESAANSPDEIIDVLSKNLDRQNNKDILSGGYWSAPGHQIGDSLTNVFWKRNLFGLLEYDNVYEHNAAHLQQEWFNIANYGQPGDCAWSRLYQDESSAFPKMTCAVAVKRKSDYLGVVTVDVSLSELNEFAAKTAQKTGGYVFIMDKDNRFIAYGGSTDSNGEIAIDAMNNLNRYTNKYPDFGEVATAVARFDNEIITSAKQRLADQFETSIAKLRADTPSLSQPEAEMEIATLNEVLTSQFNDKSSTLFAMAEIGRDAILEKKSANAYLFHVPETFWKLGIVIPKAKATAVADMLSSRLLTFLLIVIGLLGLVSYLLIERGVINPIRRTSGAMEKVGLLINNKKYLALKENKLHVKSADEVGMVRQSVNLLIDRVVENEGQLAGINESLERRVEERTQALSVALKELKQSQTQLIHSEKMSLLGQMVAGVTHEVNTPLGYVKSNILVCRDLLSYYNELLDLNRQLKAQLSATPHDDIAVAGIIENITTLADEMATEQVEEDFEALFGDTLFGVEQISELVVSLKDFARLDESKVKSVDIHDCIKSALKIAQNNIKSMEVEKNYDTTLPTVSCSPSQINQILLNLFNNAAHATEGQAQQLLSIKTYQDADYVVVEVTDNGCGMPEETRKKIFEPFFTTKPAGEGTGLGLAICHQIIEQHQGELKVESKEGIGTKFSIYLPIVSALKTASLND